MRYRLEGRTDDAGEKKLFCTVWPEPFAFSKTPEEEKETTEFAFTEEGVKEAVAWMNDRLSEEKGRWEHAAQRWDSR